MADAWFSKDAVITIERAGEDSTTSITAEVTAFNQSGGAEDTSSIPVFGGGEITKEERPDQLEVSFDIVPYDDLWAWETRYGAETSTASTYVVKSDGTRNRYRVTVTWAGGFDSGTPKEPNSGKALRYTYVNALGVSVDTSEDADGELVATVSFKLAKTDADGNPQHIIERTADASSNPLLDPYGDNGVRVAFDGYTYS